MTSGPGRAGAGLGREILVSTIFQASVRGMYGCLIWLLPLALGFLHVNEQQHHLGLVDTTLLVATPVFPIQLGWVGPESLPF